MNSIKDIVVTNDGSKLCCAFLSVLMSHMEEHEQNEIITQAAHNIEYVLVDLGLTRPGTGDGSTCHMPERGDAFSLLASVMEKTIFIVSSVTGEPISLFFPCKEISKTVDHFVSMIHPIVKEMLTRTSSQSSLIISYNRGVHFDGTISSKNEKVWNDILNTCVCRRSEQTNRDEDGTRRKNEKNEENEENEHIKEATKASLFDINHPIIFPIYSVSKEDRQFTEVITSDSVRTFDKKCPTVQTFETVKAKDPVKFVIKTPMSVKTTTPFDKWVPVQTFGTVKAKDPVKSVIKTHMSVKTTTTPCKKWEPVQTFETVKSEEPVKSAIVTHVSVKTTTTPSKKWARVKTEHFMSRN